MTDDPASASFELYVRAMLDIVESEVRVALADAMDTAAASIKARAAVPVSDAAARERAK